MRIAVTGEGPTDYGKREYKTGVWEWGPIAVYLRKIAEQNNVKIELVPIERKTVEDVRLQSKSLKGLKGKAIQSKKFRVQMVKEQCEYGVYYCDADRDAGAKNSNKHQTIKRFKEKYAEVELGLNSSDNKRIPMIPVRMIENWMLADQGAIETVYNKKSSGMKIRPQCELLWGDKNDPASDYPKNYLTRFVRNLDKCYAKSELGRAEFVEIAENQDLSIVRKNCEIGFEQFYQDYEKMLQSM